MNQIKDHFNRLIHEPLRLAIVAELAENESRTFNDLKSVLNTTDGNLSVHSRKLEAAGYVKCSKTFQGRSSRTEYKLTVGGRRAFESYLFQMEGVIWSYRLRKSPGA